MSEQQEVLVAAPFATTSYSVLDKHSPLSEQQEVVFASNFGTLVLLSQSGGGGYKTTATSQSRAVHAPSNP